MPITKFQRQVFKCLSKNRNPNSYVAGGSAIHRSEDSLRYSNDIDLFHDTDIAVVEGFTADKTAIEKVGWRMKIHIQQPSFIRATVLGDDNEVELDWARDTAFRFFPVVEDALLGYRLHDIDLAVNKVLALANRNVVRDIIDVVDMNEKVLALDATVWAACGKDPGFTPELLLDMMSRNSGFSPSALDAEQLQRPINAPELKRKFLDILAKARLSVLSRNPKDLGCVYLDSRGEIIKNLPKDSSRLISHFGSVGGAWPKISTNKN